MENTIVTIKPEENDTRIEIVGGNNIEVIVIEEGIKKLEKGSLRFCPKLKEVHLPKSVTYLGDKLFQEKYSEIKFIYEGTSEEFKQISYEREIYIPGSYDRYPYYSSYGASSETERFYRLYDSVYMWCEVYCKGDNTTLTYGEKR